MKERFSIGDRVELSEACRKVCTGSLKFQTGTVVRIGFWNIYDVKWDEIPKPISMRQDEIVIKA